MHELPIIKKILSVVLARAREYRVSRIKTIFLQIGALSDLQDEWMQRYFDYLSRDTPAASAKLRIEKIPAKVQCLQCTQCFELDPSPQAEQMCPACGGEKYRLLSGKGYFIDSIEAY